MLDITKLGTMLLDKSESLYIGIAARVLWIKSAARVQIFRLNMLNLRVLIG